VPADESPDWKMDRQWEMDFPLGVTSCLETVKQNGHSAGKYLIMGYLNLAAAKLCLEFLEDSLLEELCRKFVGRASSGLEGDL
jgi:hypothetical protein